MDFLIFCNYFFIFFTNFIIKIDKNFLIIFTNIYLIFFYHLIFFNKYYLKKKNFKLYLKFLTKQKKLQNKYFNVKEKEIIIINVKKINIYF